MRPEMRTVLTHAPRLGFVASFGFGGSQRRLRHARGAILLRVEVRDVDAHDLTGLIARDPLRGCVPAGHPAGRIEQAHGVIGYAADEQLEVSFRRYDLVPLYPHQDERPQLSLKPHS